MTGFHKDNETGKWYCDDCKKEVPLRIIMQPSFYGMEEHICGAEE